MTTKRVRIPASEEHIGLYAVNVTLNWVCPVCGGGRGDVHPAVSYDGGLRLHCDGWENPCGHVDKYAAVRQEARQNGLNEVRP